MSHGITNSDSMFSVREMPWHGLGVVLDEYPRSIDEALDKAGLGWKVTHGDVLVVRRPEWIDDFGTTHPADLIPARRFKANVREDTGEVLGIVSDEYEVVDNRDAFRFLDALIGSELHFETAGSLWGGRRVWCLARLPEHVELGGDPSGTYIYVANSQRMASYCLPGMHDTVIGSSHARVGAELPWVRRRLCFVVSGFCFSFERGFQTT